MSTLGASNGSSLDFDDIVEQGSPSISRNSSDALLSSANILRSAIPPEDTPFHWNGKDTDVAAPIQNPAKPAGHGVEQVFSNSTCDLIDETAAPDLSLLMSAYSPLQDWEGDSDTKSSNSPSDFEWDAPVVPTMDNLSTPDLNAPLFPIYDYVDVDVPLPKEKTDAMFTSLGSTSYPLACL